MTKFVCECGCRYRLVKILFALFITDEKVCKKIV